MCKETACFDFIFFCISIFLSHLVHVSYHIKKITSVHAINSYQFLVNVKYNITYDIHFTAFPTMESETTFLHGNLTITIHDAKDLPDTDG